MRQKLCTYGLNAINKKISTPHLLWSDWGMNQFTFLPYCHCAKLVQRSMATVKLTRAISVI